MSSSLSEFQIPLNLGISYKLIFQSLIQMVDLPTKQPPVRSEILEKIKQLPVHLLLSTLPSNEFQHIRAAVYHWLLGLLLEPMTCP